MSASVHVKATTRSGLSGTSAVPRAPATETGKALFDAGSRAGSPSSAEEHATRVRAAVAVTSVMARVRPKGMR
ncbi:hypothetical protein [Rhodococcus sp. 114MFTsu3.1]|uniref:hypothetical protein n=1 Tax=Rhodococcus sp. 114MFTsu3.1 TaxID=1172184 RepID=UPI00037375A5|nr:hypothetical protein [Rhodococcus sp. 114MFTsu3.1]